MGTVADDGSYQKYGRFIWIDNLVRRYPAYTHDDIFYLEFDFAMMLLMIAKDDGEYDRRYQKEAKRQAALKTPRKK